MRAVPTPSVAILLAALCAGGASPVAAVSTAALESCGAIPADAERLACYDRLAGRPPPEPRIADAVPVEPPLLTALSRHWELDDAAKHGAFLFRAHHPNYFLPAKYSTNPNNSPFLPSFPRPNLGLDPFETELQLSFKIKALEGVLGNDDADLWFGYTATSYWQAYNDDISAPFRETSYEPEAMLVFRTDYPLGGFRGRFVNLGLSHQSNGRREGLSRSWNRVYAQFGFERDKLAVMVRPWVRIPERRRDDDNPDITDYMGHGDVLAVYQKGRHAYSLLLRNNLKTRDNRGALKLSWRFPLYGRLKGYVQYFTGYGESLIDYNHRQQSIGLGVSLADGM